MSPAGEARWAANTAFWANSLCRLPAVFALLVGVGGLLAELFVWKRLSFPPGAMVSSSVSEGGIQLEAIVAA